MLESETHFVGLRGHDKFSDHSYISANNDLFGRGTSKVLKQLGLVKHLSFSKTQPHYLAVTTATRIVLYDENVGPCRSISKFADQAYCGTFRGDGKLLAAGDESGAVQIFDSTNQALIRRLVGHSKAVHSVDFLSSNYEILSGGDDTVVRLWDIPEGKTVSCHKGHDDYVRSVSTSPYDHNIWASGGYDHVCNIWDKRPHSNREPLARLSHEEPVEALSFHPSGNIIYSAAGSQIYAWDLRVRKLLHSLKPHQKTITSIVLCTLGDKDCYNLISSSLDGYCKTIDLSSFKVKSVLKHSQPITSMALSCNNQSLALGMADGTLWVRNPKKTPGKAAGRERMYERKESIRRQSDGGLVKFSDSSLIERREKAGLAGYDRLLRRFSYSKAFECVLRSGNVQVFGIFISEMIARGTLEAALTEMNAQKMTHLIKFITKYIQSPNMSLSLIHLCRKLLDFCTLNSMETNGEYWKLLESFGELHNILLNEIRLQDEFLIMKGIMLNAGM